MIPTPYRTLPGFRTAYSETELLQAIAFSEVMTVNGQGGGTTGGATLTEQETQSGYLLQVVDYTGNTLSTLSNVGDNVSRIYSDTQQIQPALSDVQIRILGIWQILTRVPLYTSGTASNTTNNVIVAAQGAGTRIFITELTISNLSPSASIQITLTDSANTQFSVTLLGGASTVVRQYSPGREMRLGQNTALQLQGSTATGYSWSVGYFATTA
jgi:hypothetical protein